jgi:hypothetical protein
MTAHNYPHIPNQEENSHGRRYSRFRAARIIPPQLSVSTTRIPLRRASDPDDGRAFRGHGLSEFEQVERCTFEEMRRISSVISAIGPKRKFKLREGGAGNP